MKVYLDLCVYNRPFDDQSAERVQLEANIFVFILQLVEKGAISLIGSEALEYENDKNPHLQKKTRVASYFNLARQFIEITELDMARARDLVKLGLDDIDALHIALAERARSDFFVTCDDDIIAHYRKHKTSIRVKVVTLSEFIARELN